jgi:hypothetical protein
VWQWSFGWKLRGSKACLFRNRDIALPFIRRASEFWALAFGEQDAKALRVWRRATASLIHNPFVPFSLRALTLRVACGPLAAGKRRIFDVQNLQCRI